MKKKILGLDLGTNSIGWALIEQDFENRQGKVLGMGSRIIPMSQDILSDFDKGNSISQTAARTAYRSTRRLRERHLLRRGRLHRVLNVLGFLPEHYTTEIDFNDRLGKFREDKEPKLAYCNRQFIFKNSFEEMLADFKIYQPELLKNDKGEDKIVPYDWTIYFLRKKALSKKIEKEELAWLILNFNQKRGYYQLRGEEEEEENPNKLEEYYSLKIVDVIADEKPNSKGEIWYSLTLENGWVYRRASKIPLFDWKDKIRDFIVTTEYNDDGSVKTDKQGNEKRSFRAPGEDDWALLKKKTEREIINSNKTIGAYIYDTLLQNPNQKIKGKLIRTIERTFYKSELKQILETQTKFHPELQNGDIYSDCVRELYRYNEAHQVELSKKDFVHLFVNDIIFYQRPLKSKRSTIGNCTLEFRTYKDAGGNKKIEYIKAISKSHPLYQEFRLWQWICNLRIYKKEGDIDVTDHFIKDANDVSALFEFLNEQKEIEHKTLLKFLVSRNTEIKGKALTEEIKKYRWNYVYDPEKDESKKYPCNETRYEISKRLSKVENIPTGFLTAETEKKLWHIIYSITDKQEFIKALKTFAQKNNIDEASFLENFERFPPFKSEYGAFSQKAISKLLPLMRTGKYWDWEIINPEVKERIDKIITGEYDNNLKDRVREKAIHLTKDKDFQGLPLWLASYIVYGRHSEANNVGRWKKVDDLEVFLKEFKQHSLRNPIVEQVVTEALRVVRDIWQKYGNGIEDFFDEIHIELGREMKNTADERKRISKRVSENENTNLRIKLLLAELINDDNVKQVRPYSPMQHEALKIYEEGVLNSDIEIDDDILKISRMAEPSSAELKRYKLWLEQKYHSPYTGKIIPLNKLFTAEYEIEHVIPQSLYFDDSLSNKVICESAVNKLKANQLGLEFIKNHHGEKVDIGNGGSVEILNEEAYIAFVDQHYTKNRTKRNKLLLEDIPEKMIERQINDTRYISKFISTALSNIVRSGEEDDGINSKNIIHVNGAITNTLKQDWGLNDVWNDLIMPRFERMNQLTGTQAFTSWNDRHQKYLPSVPLGSSKGFSKKRIDHRHHAVDALIIACTTRDHVNFMNNQYAKSSNKRYDLQRKLRLYEKVQFHDGKTQKLVKRDVPKEFCKPWENFTVEAKDFLEKVIISFKQNLRVINKTTNKYESYKDEDGKLRTGKDGKPKKGIIPQTKGDSWAIRKPMHKDTVSGKIKLIRVKVPKGNILTATRKTIDSSFDLKRIGTITDMGVQKILRNYLAKIGDPDIAFSPEGIKEMNDNIVLYNNGKPHQPIYQARVFEVGNKFPVGQKGNKMNKLVEAAKGTNLFFAIYWDEKKQKRNYETIPLNEVIEHQKWRATLSANQQKEIPLIPIKSEYGNFLFSLSPNDLVYVPIEEETINTFNRYDLTKEQIGCIYKTVSFTGNQIFFIRHDIATSIVNKKEFSTLNKMERSIDGKMIKETCVKINIDRIGNVLKV